MMETVVHTQEWFVPEILKLVVSSLFVLSDLAWTLVLLTVGILEHQMQSVLDVLVLTIVLSGLPTPSVDLMVLVFQVVTLTGNVLLENVRTVPVLNVFQVTIASQKINLDQFVRRTNVLLAHTMPTVKNLSCFHSVVSLAIVALQLLNFQLPTHTQLS